MTETGMCIICGGSSVPSSQKDGCNRKQKKTGKRNKVASQNWENECAKTLCEVLLGSESHSCVNYFQDCDAYCSFCEQTVRDINFTWNQIASLKKQLEKLSTIIRKRLHGNHLKIEQNILNCANTSETNEFSEDAKNIPPALESETESQNKTSSYNEKVMLIYKETGRGKNLNFDSVTEASKICKMTWPMSEDLYQEEISNNSYVGDEGEYFHNLSPQVKMEVDEEPYEDELENNYSDNDEYEDVKNVVHTGRSKRKSALVAQLKLEEMNDLAAEESDQGYCMEEDSVPNAALLEDTKVVKLEDFSKNEELETSKNKRTSKKNKVSHGKSKKALDEEKLMRQREKRKEKSRKYRETHVRKDYVIKRTIKCSEENCKSMFVTEESMRIHFAENHSGEKRPFECSKCSKRFKKHSTLKEHMRNLHSGSRSYDHYCKFCGKGYAVENELQIHYTTSHLGPNPFSCAFCDTVCSNAIDLGIHMKSVHPEDDRPKCDVCGKHFATEKSLKIHARMHDDPDSLFKCTICDHRTATATQLKIHMERHDKVKKYTCEQCGKSFNHLFSLKSHSEFHSEEKKYKCKICDKAFVKSKDCKRHEIAHTGVRAYVCQTCGRAFADKYSFNDHEKIHLREKGIDVYIRSKTKKKTTVS